MSRISAIVPAIPIRRHWLGRALSSIALQERMPDEILCRVANDRMWLGQQRNHMLAQATGEFVATLDDDDEWLPDHLRVLEVAQEATDADLVYSWFHVIGGEDPFPEVFGRPFSPDPQTPTTSVVLVRTEVARAVGGWAPWTPDEGIAPPVARLEGEDVVLWADANGDHAGEDVLFISRLVKAGAKIVHVPQRTWNWYHHGAEAPHTMGLPSKW